MKARIAGAAILLAIAVGAGSAQAAPVAKVFATIHAPTFVPTGGKLGRVTGAATWQVTGPGVAKITATISLRLGRGVIVTNPMTIGGSPGFKTRSVSYVCKRRRSPRLWQTSISYTVIGKPGFVPLTRTTFSGAGARVPINC